MSSRTSAYTPGPPTRAPREEREQDASDARRRVGVAPQETVPFVRVRGVLLPGRKARTPAGDEDGGRPRKEKRRGRRFPTEETPKCSASDLAFLIAPF